MRQGQKFVGWPTGQNFPLLITMRQWARVINTRDLQLSAVITEINKMQAPPGHYAALLSQLILSGWYDKV